MGDFLKKAYDETTETTKCPLYYKKINFHKLPNSKKSTRFMIGFNIMNFTHAYWVYFALGFWTYCLEIRKKGY